MINDWHVNLLLTAAADAVFGALYCRTWGSITSEQLAGIWLPKDQLSAREALNFGAPMEGYAWR